MNEDKRNQLLNRYGQELALPRVTDFFPKRRRGHGSIGFGCNAQGCRGGCYGAREENIDEYLATVQPNA